MTRAVASAITEFVLIFLVVNYRRVKFAQRWIENSNKRFLRQSVRDPELRRKLTPDYGMGCKRPSVSNHYLRTFNRDNVELITDPIERVTPNGIRTVDGERAAGRRARARDRLPDGVGSRELPPHAGARAQRVRPGDALRREPAEVLRGREHARAAQPLHDLRPVRLDRRVVARARRDGVAPHHARHRGMPRARRDAGGGHAGGDGPLPFALVEERMSRSLWFSSNCATANSYYFDHHGDVPFLRPTSGRQAQRASRTFPLDDYGYATAAGRV